MDVVKPSLGPGTDFWYPKGSKAVARDASARTLDSDEDSDVSAMHDHAHTNTRRTSCDSQSLKQRIMVVTPAMMLWRRAGVDELAAKWVAGMQLFFGRLNDGIWQRACEQPEAAGRGTGLALLSLAAHALPSSP
jgi:hypothetical protein